MAFCAKGGAVKQTNTPSFRWGNVSGACSNMFTIEDIDIFNDYPQKVGSDSEPSRGRLQPSRGAERDFLRKRRSSEANKYPAF